MASRPAHVTFVAADATPAILRLCYFHVIITVTFSNHHELLGRQRPVSTSHSRRSTSCFCDWGMGCQLRRASGPGAELLYAVGAKPPQDGGRRQGASI